MRIMDQNTEFLNYIYQNSEMGVDTIKQIIKIVKHDEFSKHLQLQLKDYQDVYDTAKQMLQQSGHQEKDIGSMQKVTTYMAISMKTLVDKTPSHISEMLIQGSTMGVIDAEKNIKKYSGSEKSILDLARGLLKIEENNIERLKHFL